jgi:hypothetical protein
VNSSFGHIQRDAEFGVTNCQLEFETSHKVNLIVGQRWRQEIPRALRSSSLFDEHHYFEFYPLHVVHKRSHINRKKTGTG